MGVAVGMKTEYVKGQYISPRSSPHAENMNTFKIRKGDEDAKGQHPTPPTPSPISSPCPG